jgi:hypothetical protein
MLTGLKRIVMLAVPDKGASRLFNKKEQGCYFLSCPGSGGNVRKQEHEQAEDPCNSLAQYLCRFI